MKAINNQNQKSMKQLILALSMLLFLFSASKTTISSEIGNINTTNALSQTEIYDANQLSVVNDVSFSFSIPEAVYVKFAIFDAKGNELKVLIDGDKAAGSFNVELISANLKKGSYYYRLDVGKYKEVRKLNIID